MRFWWVNQNKTFQQEVAGGYLWSPKRKANNHVNPFYETMREVSPGDLVLSFQGTYIRAVGMAVSHCYNAPQPTEFGAAGQGWPEEGWRVDVRFQRLRNEIRPQDHMDAIRPVLPSKYSPLRATGSGSQSVYLAEIAPAFMHVLAGLIGSEAQTLMATAQAPVGLGESRGSSPAVGLFQWENFLEQSIASSTEIPETEKQTLILARRGQGRFKDNVLRFEQRCRVTRVNRLEHLRASHCKPWRSSTNEERLDGENGLLLTPSIDHLFDRGFISFEDRGRLLISPVAHAQSLKRMGIPDGTLNVGSFTQAQRSYLDFHRNYVFLQARRSST